MFELMLMIIKIELRFATTNPIPTCFAFSIAKLMQNFPTTGPSKLFPSTCAVATVCFTIAGWPVPMQAFLSKSFMYSSFDRKLDLLKIHLSIYQ